MQVGTFCQLFFFQFVLKSHTTRLSCEILVQNLYCNFVGKKIECGSYHKNSETQIFSKQPRTYPFLDTPDLIKLLARIIPNLQEANADCANAGRGAQGPAAAARVRMQAVGSPG